MRFLNVFARASSKPNKDSKPDFRGRVVIEGFENKHESMQELKPLELSAIRESSEGAGEKNREVIGSHSLCLFEEDSWQILVVKPMKKEETKSAVL